ncbi:MAG: hypothetical protein WED11_05185, partial [Natronospirillum sp.]
MIYKYLKVATATSVLALGMAQAAHSAPILTISGEGVAAAEAAELQFLASFQPGSAVAEDFEAFSPAVDASQQSLVIASAVGSFSMDSPGSGGICDSSSIYTCDDGLAVLDDANSPFIGRFAMPTGSENWLDSMDAETATYSPTAGYNAVGFYLTDTNDQGGSFSIGGDTYDFANIFGGPNATGSVYYVTLFDGDGLSDMTFYANNSKDG